MPLPDCLLGRTEPTTTRFPKPLDPAHAPWRGPVRSDEGRLIDRSANCPYFLETCAVNSPVLPRPGAKPTSLVLAAVAAVAVVLVLYLDSEDNRTMCANHSVGVPWSRIVLAYGGLAAALAALAVAGRRWWTRRALPVSPRGSLAMLVVMVLLVGAAGLAVVSTHNVLDFAEQSRQPNSLVVCVGHQL